MNTTQLIAPERAVSSAQTLIGAGPNLPTHRSSVGRLLRPALGLLGVVAILLSLAAFGADPAGETTNAATAGGAEPQPDSLAAKAAAKVAASGEMQPHRESLFSKMMSRDPITGGMDPHGDSWLSIQNSIGQFLHWDFVLRLFLSLSLAVGCAWVVAWHPRRATRMDPLSDFEERKTLIILGVVGAVVAELSGTSATLAFVIFGIGALMRFRTLLDNPKVTGKAILVVVIGLACGMGSWTMAVFVTAFSWVLVYWLDSRVTCRIRVRIEGAGDPDAVYSKVQPVLVAHGCRIVSYAQSRGKKRLVFFVHMPADLDQGELEADVKAKFPKTQESQITIELD